MKVFPRFLSRAVVHEENEGEHDLERKRYPMITEGSLCTSSLTVWKKSLVMSCKGFTVIDSYGNLVYRVDNYCLHPHELVLMDASGNSLLTMRRRRKLGIVDSWFVYEGEIGNNGTRKTCKLGRSRKSPVCCVRKSVNILNGNPNVQAYAYRLASDKDKRQAAFTVEGSYAQRTCKVLDECKRTVAEIKRKETNTKDVSFGMEVFQLIVDPGFDPGFAMGLVLVLDQMFS